MPLNLGLDPGHGGDDKGAVGNGIIEADWNMEFCRYLAQRIRNSGEPWKPVLLRSSETEQVALMERGGRSKDAMCDLVLSVHVNAAAKKEWHGLLTFHWPGSWTGRQLGETMMRAAPRPLYKPGFGSTAVDDSHGSWIQAPRNVLRVHQCPAVLLEVGYCTNERDARALIEPAVQAGLAAMVELALSRFRYLKENPR